MSPGTRDSVHRIHWLGDAVIYLVNVAKNKELHDLFPSPNNYVE